MDKVRAGSFTAYGSPSPEKLRSFVRSISQREGGFQDARRAQWSPLK